MHILPLFICIYHTACIQNKNLHCLRHLRNFIHSCVSFVSTYMYPEAVLNKTFIVKRLRMIRLSSIGKVLDVSAYNKTCQIVLRIRKMLTRTWGINFLPSQFFRRFWFFDWFWAVTLALTLTNKQDKIVFFECNQLFNKHLFKLIELCFNNIHYSYAYHCIVLENVSVLCLLWLIYSFHFNRN